MRTCKNEEAKRSDRYTNTCICTYMYIQWNLLATQTGTKPY